MAHSLWPLASTLAEYSTQLGIKAVQNPIPVILNPSLQLSLVVSKLGEHEYVAALPDADAVKLYPDSHS